MRPLYLLFLFIAALTALSCQDRVLSPGLPDGSISQDGVVLPPPPSPCPDQDGDGLGDSEEDPGGDGLLGCCFTKCGVPASAWQKANCLQTTDGCGAGQKCEKGLCTPSLSFQCSQGETDPTRKDSFGDGFEDGDRGSFVCRGPGACHPGTRVQPAVQRSHAGAWQVALSRDARYSLYEIPHPLSKEAAAAIDFGGSDEQVAGFVLSMDSAQGDIRKSITKILGNLGSGSTVRASGTHQRSHDGYDMVEGSIIDLTAPGSEDVSSLRNRLVARLLGRDLSTLGKRPGPMGPKHKSLVLRFSTVRRFAFKRDAGGKVVLNSSKQPVDSGDRTFWRLVVMGAVAAKADYQDPTRQSGLLVDDLANGTALAAPGHHLVDQCDALTRPRPSRVDALWLLDGSPGMQDHLPRLRLNAANWFDRAVSSGLDFRVAVDGCMPLSRDRFLQPSERAAFVACLQNPPPLSMTLARVRQAVTRRLPRSDRDPAKILPPAILVIFVASARPADNGFGEKISPRDEGCYQRVLSSRIEPTDTLNLLSGLTNPAATAMFHFIGGTCGNTCGATISPAYLKLTARLGGQVMDICQKNLGNSLQVSLDSVIGCSCPMMFSRRPVSGSLAVALGGKQLQRSRTSGFDFRTNGNALVLISVKGWGYQVRVTASYKSWSPPVF